MIVLQSLGRGFTQIYKKLILVAIRSIYPFIKVENEPVKAPF
ncbi:hypothetical protein [Salinimicrobium sp. GXAS 041]